MKTKECEDFIVKTLLTSTFDDKCAIWDKSLFRAHAQQ